MMIAPWPHCTPPTPSTRRPTPHSLRHLWTRWKTWPIGAVSELPNTVHRASGAAEASVCLCGAWHALARPPLLTRRGMGQAIPGRSQRWPCTRDRNQVQSVEGGGMVLVVRLALDPRAWSGGSDVLERPYTVGGGGVTPAWTSLTPP